LFIFFRLSARNDARAGFALRPHQKHHLTIEQTETLQPLLAVGKPGVFLRDQGRIEHGFDGRKVCGVASKIAFAFRFVPSDHLQTVSTKREFVNVAAGKKRWQADAYVAAGLAKETQIKSSVRPDPSAALRTKGIVEGLAAPIDCYRFNPIMVRQAHHERIKSALHSCIVPTVSVGTY
jgi:hypothetical protein